MGQRSKAGLAELKVRIEKIDAKRLKEDANQDSDAVYKVSVSLSEKERAAGLMALNFVLDLTTQPEIAKITVSGTAYIEAQREEIFSMLKSEDPKMPPPILAKTYERLYGTIYLLSDALKVPHPLPSLLKSPQAQK